MSKNIAKQLVYPICVRHLKSRKDVRLRHFFLCQKCMRFWTEQAFDGNGPLYTGEIIKGYCGLCNHDTDVQLCTWFLCDICHRVAGSIGRNHVAEEAILVFWRKHISQKYPFLEIEQNDKSSLRPRRDTDVAGEGPLDFLIRDARSGDTVFGIENKTGRSSLKEMSAFQLDISDCDSILHHVTSLSIPAYLIHAQVLEHWKPPTVGFYVAGLWWTDIYKLGEHFKQTKMRRDENRGAAFFGKKAFADIGTLSDSIVGSDGHLLLPKAMRTCGIPRLYQAE